MSIAIISGTPGAGKTSLARRLAAGDPAGVHVEADVFFRFLAHRIDPSLPEARDQNVVVVRAYAAAAREFSSGGHAVYVDGVIGPWMLPLVASMVPAFDYVLLHAPLDLALARTTARAGQQSARPEVVRRMHEQFAQVLDAHRRHVILTGDRSVEDVEREFRSCRPSGCYRLHGG